MLVFMPERFNFVTEIVKTFSRTDLPQDYCIVSLNLKTEEEQISNHISSQISTILIAILILKLYGCIVLCANVDQRNTQRSWATNPGQYSYISAC